MRSARALKSRLLIAISGCTNVCSKPSTHAYGPIMEHLRMPLRNFPETADFSKHLETFGGGSHEVHRPSRAGTQDHFARSRCLGSYGRPRRTESAGCTGGRRNDSSFSASVCGRPSSGQGGECALPGIEANLC